TLPRPVDVRIVAATNRALREEIAAGRFREDLYFRLNVLPIQLAPLRERREDILPLARRFLARHAAEVGRQLAFTPEAEQALVAHAWPGNVRELENAVERAGVLARGATISPEDFLLEAATAAPAVAAGATLQAQLDLSAAGHARAGPRRSPLPHPGQPEPALPAVREDGAERCRLGAREVRIFRQPRERLVARGPQERGVAQQVRDPEVRESRLSRAEEVTRPA